jgi:Cohesin domain
MKLNARILATYFALSSLATAATITMSSTGSTTVIGSSVTVSFQISGLTSAAAPSLAAFDLDVTFDPTVLQFASASFIDPATALNQLDFPEIGGLGFLGLSSDLGASVDVFGVSGNSAAVLDSSQAGQFTFVSLAFTTLSAKQTTIALNLLDPNLLFGDAGGNPLSPTFGRVSSTITPGAFVVPEPGTWTLCGAALPLLLLLARSRGKQ